LTFACKSHAGSGDDGATFIDHGSADAS
jgi:hypothetical protein